MKSSGVVQRRVFRVGQIAVAVGVGFFAAYTMRADVLVKPVNATAQSYYQYNSDIRDPAQAINGSGMSSSPVTKDSTASNGRSYGWLSNGTRETWIAFDLGSVRTVTGILVWNYNESVYFTRAIKTCEARYGDTLPEDGLAYSDAGSWGSLAEELTFTCGTGINGLEGERVMFSTPLKTRYVMLRVLDNYSASDAYTGISEVRFYATERTCIAPVAATAQSTWKNRTTDQVINGAGMLPLPVTEESFASCEPAHMWLSNSAKDTWIAFDMGDANILAGAYVWNYNEVNYPSRGIKTCELRYGDFMPTNGMTYADAGNWGTLAEELTLACGTGVDGFPGEEVSFTAPIKARYVMLRTLSNHGDASYTGLAEIRFFPREFQCIAPVAATSQDYYTYGGRDPRYTISVIDGTGLSDTSRPSGTGVTHGTSPDHCMWESNGTKPTWITFDLGAERDIAGFHLWNYNEWADRYASQLSGRGVKSASIYVGSTLPAQGTSLDGVGSAWGTLVQGMTFIQATASQDYTGENYFFDTPVRGRYLQFCVNENFMENDNYVGMSEIVFYEVAGERQVTRGSSGDKVIVDAPTDSVSITDGTGDVAPVTLGAETTTVKKLTDLAADGVAQVQLGGNTLAVTDIEVPSGRPGLEILSGGTLTCAGGVRNWIQMPLDSDLKIGSSVAANSYGAVNIVKTGEGTLTFEGADMSVGEIAFTGGTCVFSGGTSVASVMNTFTDSCAVVGDGHVADWKSLQFDGASSLAVTNGGVLRIGAVDGSATAFSLFIDGGALATRATGSNGTLIPALGGARLGDGGATFDTSNGSAVLEAAITNETGSITKTGANTLTLARHVSTTGTVTVAEGTLALDIAPLIHYDFDTYNGGNIKNLGRGGTTYDGVVSGAPATVEGVAGNALQFSASSNGVATANTVSLRNYTYAAWVKGAGSSGKAQRIIIGGTYLTVPYLGFLGIDYDNNLWNFVLNSSDTGKTSAALHDDTENWHHVASTYDGYTVKLYYDGELIQQTDTSYAKSVHAVKIGFGNNVTPNGEYFNGAMDEVYVFDRPLTAEEIALLKKRTWKELNVLSPDCDLVIGASATLDLGSTDQTVKTLTIGANLKCFGETTWGAVGSGAEHESARMTGRGILRVLGPEPRGTVLIVQ